MGDTTVQFSLLGNDYGTYMILVDGATGDILSTIPVDVTWPTGSDALLKDVTISEYLKTLGSTKGLQIAILDENGDQITDFGGDTSSLATEASLQLITALIDSGSLKVVDSLGATAANQRVVQSTTEYTESDLVGNDLTITSSKGIWIKNDGTSDLTITINSMTFTVKPGEAGPLEFANAFTTVTFSTSPTFRLWGITRSA